MLIIPAIDLKDGQCVRLRQGRMEENTIFSDKPVAMAKRWLQAGARRLHIVDLNGAFEGKPMNAGVIHEIVEAHPEIPIQVGGGIRNEQAIETYLEVGVQYVIIGTQAVQAPHFVSRICAQFSGHIIVSLDAHQGKIATEGWSKISSYEVTELAKRFEQEGVEAVIFTDISRDGMMQGINVDAVVTLARSIRIPVIAAGGITTLQDIQALCEVAKEGLLGAITGRAIYEGTLDFAEAQRLADKYAQSG